MKFLIFVGLVACVAADHEFIIWNNCAKSHFIAFLNNPNNVLPANGGFTLAAHQNRSVKVLDHWAGRIWGKTNCDATGHRCDTGDNGVPTSLAEFTTGGSGEQDYYDVSLVDGYNLPMSIIPIEGTFKRGSSNHYGCGVAGCNDDLNTHCPTELQVKNAAGAVVACLSACAKFKTDEYCCGGAHNKPETCKSTDWAVNYPAIFKKACPDAYSYAYDDVRSTFTCHGNPHSGYVIKFCP